MLAVMDTHALIAITIDGQKLELGRVRSKERAAHLRSRLTAELGDEYRSFEIVDLDPLEEPIEVHVVMRRQFA